MTPEWSPLDADEMGLWDSEMTAGVVADVVTAKSTTFERRKNLN